jgi:hypothetical protein
MTKLPGISDICFQILPNFAFKFNLCRYIAEVYTMGGVDPGFSLLIVGGLYKLNPVDPEAWKRMVSTLEPVMWYPGFEVCYFKRVNLYRYVLAHICSTEFGPSEIKAGAVQLESSWPIAWNPPGFNPCAYQVKTQFQILLSFTSNATCVPLRQGRSAPALALIRRRGGARWLPLTHSWKEPGTQVVSTLAPVKWKKQFQKVPFKRNLHRYATAGTATASGAAAAPTNVESGEEKQRKSAFLRAVQFIIVRAWPSGVPLLLASKMSSDKYIDCYFYNM